MRALYLTNGRDVYEPGHILSSCLLEILAVLIKHLLMNINGTNRINSTLPHGKYEEVAVVANVANSTEVTALAREGREMPEQSLC
jgi:hypothetical protein